MRCASRAIIVLSTLVSVACGSDSTGPSIVGAPALAGTWRFSYSNMSGMFQGITVTCTGSSLDFTLTQTGVTFSGVQVGTGRATCSALGSVVLDEPIASETIINGTISGSNVTFRLGTIAGQHTGTVSGTSMSGAASWVITDGASTLTLNGQFTAARM